MTFACIIITSAIKGANYIIAYEGKDPYVFVSYSHRDADKVVPIITSLKQSMCRVRNDEGLNVVGTSGWRAQIPAYFEVC